MIRTRPRSARRYLRRLMRAGDGRRFVQALRGRRRMSALRALVDGPFVVARLRRQGLSSLVHSFPSSPAGPPDEAARVASAVDAGLAVLPMAFTCLRRSVVLLRELRRCQVGGELRIGVRRGQAGMEAHAWVQVGDEVVNDDEFVVRTYLPFDGDHVALSRLRFR